MSTKRMDIPDFCARVEDELLAVEKEHTTVALTRDGQVIAYLSPAAEPKGSRGTLGDWIGSGSGFMLPSGCSLDEPTWAPEEWEEFPDPGDEQRLPAS